MKKLYTDDKKNFLLYHKQESKKNKGPYIIFLHGLMSNMNGQKAIAIENYCLKHNYNFIRFDNFGHGGSSFKFTECTISDWLEGLNIIVHQLTEGPILLIGSSMGAWIATLAANLSPYRKKVIGLITLAAAVDFTEEVIWSKLSNLGKDLMIKNGLYDVCGDNDNCMDPYPISYGLIVDGRKHLLLNKNIDIECPIHLIHGMKDVDVPYTISLKLADKIKSQDATVKLIKDADHKLSRKKDLNILYNTIDEILDKYE